MAMNTWACIDHGKVNTVGLCHGVQNGWRQIATALGIHPHTDLDIICSGINHQTWYIGLNHKGRDIIKDEWSQRLKITRCFPNRKRCASMC